MAIKKLIATTVSSRETGQRRREDYELSNTHDNTRKIKEATDAQVYA